MPTDPNDLMMGGSPRAVADDHGPGPWFPAAYPGGCETCGQAFHPGEMIRADGSGGWEAKECCGEYGVDE